MRNYVIITLFICASFHFQLTIRPRSHETSPLLCGLLWRLALYPPDDKIVDWWPAHCYVFADGNIVEGGPSIYISM